jgi:hypothetical protein
MVGKELLEFMGERVVCVTCLDGAKISLFRRKSAGVALE